MPREKETKRSSFAALLREHGFEGSAPTFRRFIGKDFVELVNLQASRGEFYVNLGAHYRWLGKPYGSWEQIKEYQCAFRARLLDFAANDRFSFEDDASVIALLEMMELTGLRFFAQLEPDQIAQTARALARTGYRKFVPFNTPAEAATWAKVAARFKDTAAKKRFEAQEAAELRAREKERAKEYAQAVEMTYSAYRAAKKAGRRVPKILRFVPEAKPKKR